MPTVYESETMVITATRTLRDVEDVSIPVSVVSGEEINRSGSMRLSDILSEQTGMQIVNDHGTGIQVQGFDPDYTLIMIDGNPVIGRTTGTLDLTRISVRNVEQIEIVKGPSSALWGSDALAGVVNIITSQSTEPISGSLTTRYGENNTLDLNGSVSLNRAGWNNDISVNRNSSNGYALNTGLFLKPSRYLKITRYDIKHHMHSPTSLNLRAESDISTNLNRAKLNFRRGRLNSTITG